MITWPLTNHLREVSALRADTNVQHKDTKRLQFKLERFKIDLQ